MQIQVNVNNLTLIQSDELNENEYNIHKIQFTFSSEYSDGLAKVALFTGNSETYKVIIINDECNIPAEILANRDCFVLGVYAFDVENDELIERFSPSPIKLYILDGSYIPDEETENSEPITPTDKEQILAELAKLEIDAEQIAINKQDIADIKQEQTEQNSAIQTNAEEIEQVRSEIPDKTSQLTNDSGFVNQTQMANAIAEETTARQNADINLQEQIDAITVSSDVIDVLGTYQDLQNYDTSHVKANDVIKVLQDSTHDNAMSYYRWVITDHTGAWQYVGSEGPYYTKSEIDGKVQEINNDISGLGHDINTIEGTIEQIQEDIGNIETEQIEQNTRITELEQEVEDLQNNQLTGTAEGTEIDINDSADSRVRSIKLEGNSTQDGEPTPDNPVPIYSAGDNGTITDKIVNKNYNTGTRNGLYLSTNGKYNLASNYVCTNELLKIGSNKTITVSNKNEIIGVYFILEYDENKNYLRISEAYRNVYKITHTTSNDAVYIGVDFSKSGITVDTFEDMQIELGSTATPYIAHAEQNFIIPTQQPMRKIGDVRDFFFKNVQGSEFYDSTLTENAWYERHKISEVIFDGTEDWKSATSIATGTLRFYYDNNDVLYAGSDVILILSNKFVGTTWTAIYSTDRTSKNLIAPASGASRIVIRIDETIVNSLENFKTWLANNNVKAIYVKITPTNLPCTSEQTQVLEAYIKARTYKPVTHMYSEDKTPAYQEVVYVKDLETVINNLGGA